MVHGSGPAIDLVLRRSRALATLVFLGHALALGAAAYARLPPLLLAAAGATVVTSFVVQFRRHALLEGAPAVRRIRFDAEGGWRITDGTGAEHACELLPEPSAGPPLTILRLKDGSGRTRVALLLADSGDPEELRKLRARLRLG